MFEREAKCLTWKYFEEVFKQMDQSQTLNLHSLQRFIEDIEALVYYNSPLIHLTKFWLLFNKSSGIFYAKNTYINLLKGMERLLLRGLGKGVVD